MNSLIFFIAFNLSGTEQPHWIKDNKELAAFGLMMMAAIAYWIIDRSEKKKKKNSA